MWPLFNPQLCPADRVCLTAEAPRTNRDAPLRPIVESGPAARLPAALSNLCCALSVEKNDLLSVHELSLCCHCLFRLLFCGPVFRLCRCKAPCMVPHTFSLPPALGFVCLSIRTPRTSVFHKPYLCILIASCWVPMWLYLGLSVDQRCRSPHWPRPNSA